MWHPRFAERCLTSTLIQHDQQRKRRTHRVNRLPSPAKAPASTLEIWLLSRRLHATHIRHAHKASKAHCHAHAKASSSHHHTHAIVTSTAQQRVLTETAGCRVPRRLQPPRSRSDCLRDTCAPHTSDTHTGRARHTVTHTPKHHHHITTQTQS